MTDRTKKLIAKEGLIFSAYFIIAYIVSLFSAGFFLLEGVFEENLVYVIESLCSFDVGDIRLIVHHLNFFLILYVLVRFIIWAVRILRRGQGDSRENKNPARLKKFSKGLAVFIIFSIILGIIKYNDISLGVIPAMFFYGFFWYCFTKAIGKSFNWTIWKIKK